MFLLIADVGRLHEYIAVQQNNFLKKTHIEITTEKSRYETKLRQQNIDLHFSEHFLYRFECTLIVI